MKRFLTVICFTLLLSILVGVCGAEQKKVLKIGSKDFTESLMLGELYALALEDIGYKVERKLNLGGTQVTQAAMLSKDIDLYPEYTGTGLINVLNMEPLFDTQEVYNVVSDEYLKRWNLVWCTPTEASNTYNLTVTKEIADKFSLTNTTELQAVADKLRFANITGFYENVDLYPTLKAAYGEFNFISNPTYDNAIKYQVLKNGEADVTIAFATDGQLAEPIFVPLVDDKHVWPPYNIAPVVRKDILDNDPKVREALDKMSALIDNATMRQLNAQVDIEKEEVADVAKEFFDTNYK
jgi:osmoprotectant transport system substrate-binding protein